MGRASLSDYLGFFRLDHDMAPKERAQENHDELFPGHVSTLATTYPELIEIFDNFPFDEVLSRGSSMRGPA